MAFFQILKIYWQITLESQTWKNIILKYLMKHNWINVHAPSEIQYEKKIRKCTTKQKYTCMYIHTGIYRWKMISKILEKFD